MLRCRDSLKPLGETRRNDREGDFLAAQSARRGPVVCRVELMEQCPGVVSMPYNCCAYTTTGESPTPGEDGTPLASTLSISIDCFSERQVTEPISGVPEPFAVPWPRPSLSIVLIDPPGSVGWPSVVSSRLEDLAAQQDVEVIRPVEESRGGVSDLRPVSVIEDCSSHGEPDGNPCPRRRGMVLAVGNVVVFREVSSASGPLLGLPPLWEPCPTIRHCLGDRLRAAGVVAPSASPPTV